eukprot:11378486-Ditylum_brightwellii.AAC.1
MALEIKALNELECFDFRDAHPSRGYQRATLHMGVSIKLLHVISQRAGLNALCGDIGNAYVNAYTMEKVYTVAGPEFGPGLEGKIVVICKALYGFATLCA